MYIMIVKNHTTGSKGEVWSHNEYSAERILSDLGYTHDTATNMWIGDTIKGKIVVGYPREEDMKYKNTERITHISYLNKCSTKAPK